MNKIKRCSMCGKEKPFDCFGKHIRLRYGLRSACKECEPYIKRTDADKVRDRKNENSERLDLTDRVIKQMIWRESKKIGQAIAFIDITKEMVEEKRRLIIEYRERQKDRPPPSCKVYFKECGICSKMFTARRQDERYCSDECKRVIHLNRMRERYEPKLRLKTEYNPVHKQYKQHCIHCGEVFTSRNQRQYCPDCRQYGNGSAKDRAELFGVAYEIIDPYKVFYRDQWHCQICGKATPIKNRGKFYSNAPELDHRIPMSKGGGHLYSNVQCACRRCNAQKVK